MTLHLRHLRLRAVTGRGTFGTDIRFGEGLFVLRADNSRGKSTAVKSILFALGLERMITAQPSNAVTSAMRDRLIFDASTKEETPVLTAWVSLEISNGDGSLVTVTRWVKHDTIDSGLVQVELGPALTSPGIFVTESYYVGRAGAASNPHGFQNWLANFVNWSMPEFPTTDGRAGPLYMEQVFPLLFVEQRRGWGGIQAQMPYFSGIADVRRRAIEFLLDLDVGRLETEKQYLKAREAELQAQWRAVVGAFKQSLTGEGLFPVRLPDSLSPGWPPPSAPVVAQSTGSAWITVDDLIHGLRSELSQIERDEVPTVETAASDLEEQLRDMTEGADALRQHGAVLREELLRDREELESIGKRLVALRTDLREHQDVLTLERLGAPELDRFHSDCPVCHQQLPESLLGDVSVKTLSPQDSVNYIRQQLDLFEVMERDSKRAFQAKSARWAAHQGQEADLRAQIRTARSTLLSPNDFPSADAIAQRIRVGDRIERLSAVVESFHELLGRLDRLAEEGRHVRSALADLPAERLSETDAQRLAALEISFIEQLRSYDFGSFSDERLMISRDDYLPRRDDFDLQADISASDSIRVVWAYLLGLLEVSTRFKTNHLRLVVFDEPRQQSAKEVSFKALLRRAALDSGDAQVIFATSEELPSLQQMLADVPHTLRSIDGYVLQPIVD